MAALPIVNISLEEIARKLSVMEKENHEIKATNSEIKAANSEMKAALSEMKAANGAIQAANSEMKAALSEMKAANGAIQAANDDLEAENSRIKLRIHDLEKAFTGVRDVFFFYLFFVINLQFDRIKQQSIIFAGGSCWMWFTVN